MKDLLIGIDGIWKKEIYNKVKETIFLLIDKKSISIDRADEILLFTKSYIVKIQNAKMAKEFYIFLWNKFNELKIVSNLFLNKEEEMNEKILNWIMYIFMDKWELELVEKIQKSINNNICSIEDVIKKYPVEYRIVFKNITN